ncbi:hypothetical protein JJB11_10410 [Ramlibacter ginsenosidimutans]|uniref:Uncharacterized protein n=1 Tax=Ramlibacter ginsenosidimutans TaxID=502333 RepID=A0A934TS95_9BURK|nr:hypothetical protein [Ramlibacter ginsenosidimutans]MBK6006504.1 hypothetical protein [Ramlibacter ginsenosidimutans]
MATARKTARKTAAKKPAARQSASRKPAAKAAPAKAALPATTKADKGDKADKARKPKLVRDSFTIPKSEYTVLEALKLRAANLGRPAKKSEVLRAGVMALAAMGDAAFLASVTGVPAIKTGRPAKDAA